MQQTAREHGILGSFLSPLFASRRSRGRRIAAGLAVGALLALAVPAIAAAADAPPGEGAAPAASPEATGPSVTMPAPPPPPPEKPTFDPKVGVGAWVRFGGRIENPSDPNRLNGFFLDTLYLVASLRGQFTPWLKWQASLAAQHYTQPGDVSRDAELVIPQAGLQDLIVKFEPHDLFNIWAGKMVLPLDRANLSGPWFMNFWLIRGAFPRSGAMTPAPYGIKSGPYGREQGVTAWGQVMEGKFKYYAGAWELDVQSQNAHPMYAGRLCLNLLDPEPGYFNQSAYHGEKDILAIGAGGQYQKGGSITVIPAPNAALEIGDLKVVEFDALLDKKVGGHVVTAEVDGYFTDKFQPVNRLYLFSLGYVSPMVGPGRIAPAVRLQIATVPAVMSAQNPTGREIGLDREFRQIDVNFQYLLKSHFAKIMLGGFSTQTRLKSDGSTINAKGIQVGVQLIQM